MSRPDERSAGSTGLGVAEREEAAPSADSHNDQNQLFDRLFSICQFFGSIVIGIATWFSVKLSFLLAILMHGFDQLMGLARRKARRFAVQNDIPVGEMKARFTALMADSKAAFGEGALPFVTFWSLKVVGLLAGALKKILTTKDYLLPTAATAVFVAVMVTLSHLNFGLAVTYNGEFIGYIADESIFNRAESQMQGRIVYEDYIPPTDQIPFFKVAVVTDDQLTTVNELTNQLIMASGNEIAEAYGLYVDNQFQGATTDQTLVLGLLDSILDNHRTGDPTETVEFIQDVEVRGGLYPVSSVADIDKIAANATREVQQQRIYTVKQGDAPTLIADRNNIPYTELKKLNPGIETRLMVGQEVLLSQSVPFIGVKLIKEEVYEESIPFEIQRTVDSTKAQGTMIIDQVGENGAREVKARVSYVDGVEQERVVLDTRVTKQAVNEKVTVGGLVVATQAASASSPTTTTTTTRSSNGSFAWPVEGGGRVTCGFWGYYGHTGMDIALRSGANIRASAAGTVSLVKYSSYGYGYHVMIDHGGGVQTLYAHNSAIYVQQGQWVEQGEVIAAMGRTGRTTGVHVHFEIRIGGQYMNPANYIGNSPY